MRERAESVALLLILTLGLLADGIMEGCGETPYPYRKPADPRKDEKKGPLHHSRPKHDARDHHQNPQGDQVQPLYHGPRQKSKEDNTMNIQKEDQREITITEGKMRNAFTMTPEQLESTVNLRSEQLTYAAVIDLIGFIVSNSTPQPEESRIDRIAWVTRCAFLAGFRESLTIFNDAAANYVQELFESSDDLTL